MCLTTALFVVAACGSDEPAEAEATDDSWPDGPITILVPYGQGGFVDTAARAVATHLPETLGVPVAVENREGASGQVGHSYFLTQPPDGNLILYTAVTPYLPLNIVMTDADFALEDFEAVNIQTRNTQAVWVPADSPWQTLSDMIEDLRANPGKFSAGASFGGPGQLATVILADAAGLDPKKDVNLVLTDGGNEAQALLGGGHVDFSILNVHDTDSGLGDLVRPLAVIADEPVANYEDIPLINDELESLDIEVPITSGSAHALMVHPQFREQYPERYETLVDAYREMLESEEFLDLAEQQAFTADWIGPEASAEYIQLEYDLMLQFADLLEQE